MSSSQFSDDQQEALRTLAAFLKHEFSGRWATARELSHLKPNALKALEIAGYVVRHEYENLVAYRLTSKGWQARHALLLDAPHLACRLGDTWVLGEERWVLAGYLPNGIPVVEYHRDKVCPHCGCVVEER